MDFIKIKGARIHNLKNINVDIPRNRLVVITGISGSGKSSLAFDTIYAEGQRRYVESLSAYARQFLGMMEKPDVDEIVGLSPAIAIEQRTASKNPRSTVATVTEIYDYLRVLFARIGVPYCYKCGKKISAQTVDQIVDSILELPSGTRLDILGPLVRQRKGEYKELLNKAKRRGFIRVRVDGKISEIDEVSNLARYKKHTIEVVIDRLTLKPDIRKRLADSIEIGLKEGQGIVVVSINNREDKIFSQSLACVDCGISYEEISPRMFSFNNPYGACEVCDGLGIKMEIDPDKVIVNEELSLLEGAVGPWGEPGRWMTALLKGLSEKYDFDLDSAWRDLPKKIREIILYGDKAPLTIRYYRSDGSGWGEFEDYYEGVIPRLMRRYRETTSAMVRQEIEEYMVMTPCPTCKGARLKPASLSIKVCDLNIYEVTRMSVKQSAKFFGSLKLSEKETLIAKDLIR
ncbi:MAG: excinuclease ABC subunit UvrA, partial [candidate division WOR-3 bacterium]